MMTRILSYFAFAILLVIVVVVAVQPFKPKPSVTHEHFELLRPGMTRAEVERLLGGPPRNGLTYPAIIWLPQAAGGPISAIIGPASPAVELFVREDRPKNAPPRVQPSALNFFPLEIGTDGFQAVWNTRAVLIAVYFGEDGRLRQKYHSTLHESVPPSVIDWLASRPRMIGRSFGF
jgi:hypothetical protein